MGLECGECERDLRGGHDPSCSKAPPEIREAYERGRAEQWQPIETAPKDGTVVWVYVAGTHSLSAFQCQCSYHPDAGWCADEIREVTHWMRLPEPPEPTDG